VRGEISASSVDGGDVNKLLRERHVRPNGTRSSHLVLVFRPCISALVEHEDGVWSGAVFMVCHVWWWW
jgi:hypothetical protein